MDFSYLAQHAGSLASVFVVATYSMRSMIPLRVFGILSDVTLIMVGVFSYNIPLLVLHGILLPMNAYRLHQQLQLLREVKRSVSSDLSMDWLKPFMTKRQFAGGDIVFYKDEIAEDLLYIVSGRYRLVESGIEVPVGTITGEMGMLSPTNTRTQTLECLEGGTVLSVTYTQVEQLYVQNPQFGFYFLKLASARLFQNIASLEARLAAQTAPAAPQA